MLKLPPQDSAIFPCLPKSVETLLSHAEMGEVREKKSEPAGGDVDLKVLAGNKSTVTDQKTGYWDFC